MYPPSDPSHDALHIKRVVAMALKLSQAEGADENIVLPAAYFHDFVNVPKNDPRRKEASRLSALAAIEYLKAVDYPARHYEAIAHAIEAHSFSAGIPATTIEAKVVQDADRLDALGAVGIARCFSVSTLLQRPYYCADDFEAENRDLDDTRYAIDHFAVKLFEIAKTLHTDSARREAETRVAFMKDFLAQMQRESGL